MKPFRVFTFLLLTILLISACSGETKTSQAPTTAPKESAKSTEGVPATSAPANTPEPEPTADKTSSADLKILDVTYAHGLNDDMTPTEQADAYTPEQPVYLSVKLDGNPKKGRYLGKIFLQGSNHCRHRNRSGQKPQRSRPHLRDRR